MGEATASELRDEGIDPLVPDRENSEGLLDLAPLQDISDQKILIVRGVDGREVLAQGLESRGARVTYLEVHQRRAAKIERFDREAYEESPPSVTVVYSGSILESLVLNLGVLDTTLVVPSARVGEEAREAGFERVVVARGANESDMVDAVLSTRS